MRRHPYRIATDWQAERFAEAVRELHERAVDPQLAAILKLARAGLPAVSDDEAGDVFAFVDGQLPAVDVAERVTAAERRGEFRTSRAPAWAPPAPEEVLSTQCAGRVDKVRRQPEAIPHRALVASSGVRGLTASSELSPALRDLLALASTRPRERRIVRTVQEGERALRELASRVPRPAVVAAASRPVASPARTAGANGSSPPRRVVPRAPVRGRYSVTLTASGVVVLDRHGRPLRDEVAAIVAAAARGHERRRPRLSRRSGVVASKPGLYNFDWRRRP